MDADLHWKYERIGNRWGLVADQQSNCQAEISAIVPKHTQACRAWVVYEYQVLLAKGTAKNTSIAKRC